MRPVPFSSCDASVLYNCVHFVSSLFLTLNIKCFSLLTVNWRSLSSPSVVSILSNCMLIYPFSSEAFMSYVIWSGILCWHSWTSALVSLCIKIQEIDREIFYITTCLMTFVYFPYCPQSIIINWKLKPKRIASNKNSNMETRRYMVLRSRCSGWKQTEKQLHTWDNI